MPLLPPAAGAALLRDREQCVITEPQRRLQGCASARRASSGACCTGRNTGGFRSSGFVLYNVVTEGVRLTQQYACLRSASTSIPGRRKLDFVEDWVLDLAGASCWLATALAQTTLARANQVKRLRARQRWWWPSPSAASKPAVCHSRTRCNGSARARRLCAPRSAACGCTRSA